MVIPDREIYWTRVVDYNSNGTKVQLFLQGGSVAVGTLVPCSMLWTFNSGGGHQQLWREKCGPEGGDVQAKTGDMV